MDQDTAWKEVEAGRLRLADLLEDLSAAEWENPSLCGGWRVRDVAAHVTLPPQAPAVRWAVEFFRYGCSFDRMIRESAIRHARIPTGDIVAQMRQYAASRKVPPAPGTGVGTTMMDVLTHTMDITLPLGRPADIPPEAAVVGLQGAWGLKVPWNPRKRLRGVRCVATDADWAVGEGLEVTGPAEAFLLLLTQRPAAIARLDGPGVELAAKAIGVPTGHGGS